MSYYRGRAYFHAELIPVRLSNALTLRGSERWPPTSVELAMCSLRLYTTLLEKYRTSELKLACIIYPFVQEYAHFASASARCAR